MENEKNCTKLAALEPVIPCQVFISEIRFLMYTFIWKRPDGKMVPVITDETDSIILVDDLLSFLN